MFHIYLINLASKEELGMHGLDSDKVVEYLKSALETLKTLPPGAKIEIDYSDESEVSPE